MQIGFDVRGFFFDTPEVIKAMMASERKAMSKFGAFVRQRARTSMRRTEGPSPRGVPPNAHSNSSYATLKNIRFAFDTQRRVMTVGPLRIGRRDDISVPQLHEFGGTRRLRVKQVKVPKWFAHAESERMANLAGNWVDARDRLVVAFGGQHSWKSRIKIKYPKRPFMGPALQAESSNFRDIFKSTLRAA